MKNKKGSPTRKNLSSSILDVLRASGRKPLNPKQIASALGLNKEVERKVVEQLLRSFIEEAKAEEVERGKFRLNQEEVIVTGILEMSGGGTGFLANENNPDIKIPKRKTGNAYHGDRVRVVVWGLNSGLQPEGEVIEILERGREEFTGILSLTGSFAFCAPDQARGMPDIFIPIRKIAGAKNNEKVKVRITNWDGRGKNPEGEVIQIFGKAGDNRAEMHAILDEYDLPERFSSRVLAEAEQISDGISAAEIKKRRDFRSTVTFTIDPEDAKDFDDALSFRKLDGGWYEIGIHIADVSHYLLPGTLLDEEAINRATSVYLVDRVIPMLPERLSNHLCSLVPGEDRLCYAAVFEMNEEAEIRSEWFGRTIIHSDRRFTYEEAQKIIEQGTGTFSDSILILDKLAKQMRSQRMAAGSIAFDKQEVKFRLDSDGQPVGVFFKVMKDSNKLIEDFMLLANKRVAAFVSRKNKNTKASANAKKKTDQFPFVYRIHDDPNPEKISEFSSFVSRFGYALKSGGGKNLAQSMNKLLRDAAGKPESGIIEQLALRTMAKAVYSTQNIGHYGLAFEDYTHFTSPIRRYPDVMVHRLLDFYLNNQKASVKEEQIQLSSWIKNPEELEELCEHASERERVATDAERASVKYKQVEYLNKRVGQLFEGVITGVTEWGLYVEITENMCEGMVRLKDMQDDSYAFDEENYCFVGRRKRVIYQLGDKVRIKIKRADVIKRQVDFLLIEKLPSKK